VPGRNSECKISPTVHDPAHHTLARLWPTTAWSARWSWKAWILTEMHNITGKSLLHIMRCRDPHQTYSKEHDIVRRKGKFRPATGYSVLLKKRRCAWQVLTAEENFPPV